MIDVIKMGYFINAVYSQCTALENFCAGVDTKSILDVWLNVSIKFYTCCRIGDLYK